MFKSKQSIPKVGSSACDYFNELIVREMEKEASKPLPLDHILRAGLACSAGHVVGLKTRPNHLFFVSPEVYQQQLAESAAEKGDAVFENIPI